LSANKRVGFCRSFADNKALKKLVPSGMRQSRQNWLPRIKHSTVFSHLVVKIQSISDILVNWYKRGQISMQIIHIQFYDLPLHNIEDKASQKSEHEFQNISSVCSRDGSLRCWPVSSKFCKAKKY